MMEILQATNIPLHVIIFNIRHKALYSTLRSEQEKL